MPLTFDMPLDQLYTYTGRNPRPADFDEYWERGLAEQRATDPQVSIQPADFSAPGVECLHLYYTGVGGARIHAKLLRPARPTGAAVLFFHGLSMDSGDWLDKLPYAMAGITVAAMDCRGQGGLSEDMGAVRGNTLHGHLIRGVDDHPDKLLFRQIYLDTAQMARVVMEMPGVDPDRLGATGASQGGALTLACAALEPRLRYAAPVHPYLCDFQRVWEIDLAHNAYEDIYSYFRRFDPQHQREQDFFTRLGYIDLQHLAPRIRAEVRLATGLMDEICPPSSQFAAYNKIQSPKRLALYPEFAHEHMPHNADEIYAWMLTL